MSTTNRRYRPDVPIDLTSEEETGNNSAKDNEETDKIEVKVVRRLNSKREEDDDDDDDDDEEEEEEEGVVIFKIELYIPLRWLMIWYCQELGLDFQATRFEFNGAKLREMDTPFQLGMVHNDVISAFSIRNLGSTSYYVTPCIRMHDEWDMFFRVRSSIAILPQIMRCYPYNGSQEQCSIWFVYGGLKLTENHTANELDMKDGDIIDAFNFKAMRSSLRTVWPAGTRLTLTVKCLTGNVTTFIVTPKTLLGQVMDRLIPPDAVTGRKNIRFVFAGRTLSATNTVEEEELTDGCTIHSIRCLIGC